MKVSHRRARPLGALVAAAAVLALATGPATAGATPLRTATTTTYTDATFLQHALGLPASDTNPAIESVTYDRFQWLLQQPGNLAFLIGDPATDPTFAARSQDVEVAAKAAGVKKVYWFDPNLSGNAQVGGITEPNLDIRNPAGIALATASRTKYDNAWKAVVGQYLGDGLNVVQNGLNSENATVTVTTNTAVVNDPGFTAGASTKVGNTSGGALYDYRTGTPANAQDSVFFVYNKDNTAGGQPAKIVSWTDLTTQAGSASTKADVTTAIGTVGAANLAQIDQFAFWKSEVNAKQVAQSGSTYQGASVPVLTDADNADGWRVDQITYPELVDLLKTNTSANAVILFGGTWCPNTRPVLPSINKDAQQNNVTVYNFDTVLDGGLVGGSTTSASDPLQSRNTVNNGSTANANPTSLYGDVVSQYFTNIKTEYDYTTGGPGVTYYPGGNTTGTLTTARKLQVPFLIGYQGSSGSAPTAGVTRQWIVDDGDTTYTEYMSQWWYTNPQPGQLGISTTQLPPDAPIWTTINSQLANVTWQTDPTTLYANTATEADDAQFLVSGDKANVSNTGVASSSTSGTVVINPAALSAALTALGSSAPSNLAAAKTAYVAALAGSDATLTANLKTVVGAWGVAQTRKTKVNSTWGNATNPNSVLGGLAAVHAADVFFGGLPGGVVSQRTVTAPAVTQGTAPTISIAISNAYGRTPTGTLSLVVKKAGTTVATASTAVAQNAASFTLPVLDAGTYDYTLSYPGDDQIAAFTETGSLTVSPGPATQSTPPSTPPSTAGPKPVTNTTVKRIKVSKVKVAVVKAPTHKKAGTYRVTFTTSKGAPAATGKVTITLTKGKSKKKITGKLSRGVLTVSVPKLAKGTWKAAIAWPGDAHYLSAKATGTIKVKK